MESQKRQFKRPSSLPESKDFIKDPRFSNMCESCINIISLNFYEEKSYDEDDEYDEYVDKRKYYFCCDKCDILSNCKKCIHLTSLLNELCNFFKKDIKDEVIYSIKCSNYCCDKEELMRFLMSDKIKKQIDSYHFLKKIREKLIDISEHQYSSRNKSKLIDYDDYLNGYESLLLEYKLEYDETYILINKFKEIISSFMEVPEKDLKGKITDLLFTLTNSDHLDQLKIDIDYFPYNSNNNYRDAKKNFDENALSGLSI